MKKIILGLLTLTVGLTLVGHKTADAKEVTEKDNVFYVVESGDTLSKIADKYKVDFTVIHGNNEDTIDSADLIFTGQKLLVDGKDFDKDKKIDYSVPVVYAETSSTETSVVQDFTQVTPAPSTPAPKAKESTVAQAPATGSGDNWHKANRRKVESGNNYDTFTGNGYLGAYQFAPSTWNSIASRHGLDANDFSPANQDRIADIYAQERYNGWANVPQNGGW